MTVSQMEMIIAVAQTGSVNKAAQKLFVSQPAMSKAIQAAENELSRPIFKRSRAGMQLTDYGKIFYRMAVNVCRSYKYVREITIQQADWHYPQFKVTTCPIRFAGVAFAKLVERHCQEAAALSYSSGGASDCVNDVLDGRSDLGIIYICVPYREQVLQELERENIEYKALQRFQPIITVSRDSALSAREDGYIRLSDLDGLSLFSIYEKLPLFEKMNEMIIEMLGLDGDQASICYDSRAGLTDYIQPNEFRCNLDTEYVYLSVGRKNRLLDFSRTFLIQPPPFMFEVGYLRKANAEHNPEVEEYIEILQAMLARARQ